MVINFFISLFSWYVLKFATKVAKSFRKTQKRTLFFMLNLSKIIVIY